MVPEAGSTIEFDLDMTSWYMPDNGMKLDGKTPVKGGWYTLDGTDTRYEVETLAYAPRVWSAGPNLQQNRDADGNPQPQTDGRLIAVRDTSAVDAAPFNVLNHNGNTNECVYNGGNWTFTRETTNTIHVTVEDFVIDLSSLSNFPVQCSNAQGTSKNFYYTKSDTLHNAWDIDKACFAGGEFWMVQPLEAKLNGSNDYTKIAAHFGNGQLEYKIEDKNLTLNNQIIEQVKSYDDKGKEKNDDSKEAGCSLVNPGTYQSDIYYTKYHEGWDVPLTDGCFESGKDFAMPGQEMSILQVLSCDNAEEDYRGVAMELFIKFDDAFFEPDGGYNVHFTCPMHGNFLNGDPTYKVSWVARGDEYGWNHHPDAPKRDETPLKPDAIGDGENNGYKNNYDWNMIQAWGDQLYFYDSLEKLKADKRVCIGAFLEVRGITNRGMNHAEFRIDGKVRNDCKPGYVYMTTMTAAIYNVGDLKNAARIYWNGTDAYKDKFTIGDGPASFVWKAQADTLIESFAKTVMPWRADTNGKDVPTRKLTEYMETAFTTVHDGTTYGPAKPTFERRVGTSSIDIIPWAKEGDHNGKSYLFPKMQKAWYKDGQTGGYNDRFLLDSCLVPAHLTKIKQTTAQTTTQGDTTSNKKTYSLDMNQRSVDYVLTPSLSVPVQGSSGGATTTTVSVQATLPKQLRYIPGTAYQGGTYSQDPKCINPGTVSGGTPLEPAVTHNTDGTTTLLWTLTGVPLSSATLESIHYSCELVGTLKDQQSINNEVVIWSKEDNQREKTTSNGNKAVYGITIQSTAAVSLVKLADQSIVELNGDIGFHMSVGNNGNTDYEGIIVDDLPWNGDEVLGGEGTSYHGTMSVKEFKVTADLLKKADGGEQIMFFYTTKETYQGMTSQKYGENLLQFQDNPTDWTLLTFGTGKDANGLVTATNLPTDAVQIVGVGSVPAGKVLKMHVTVGLTGDEPGDKVVNQLTMGTFMSEAATTVVARSLEGLTWLDTNHDGLQNNGETNLSGVTVTLLQKDANGTYQPVLSKTGTPVTVQTGQKIDVLNNTPAEDYTYGHYLFENLLPGTYAVKFTSGTTSATNLGTYLASPVKVGDDRNVDSDAVPSYDATNKTLSYTMIEGIDMPALADMTETHYKVEHQDSGFYTWGAVLPATGGIGTLLYTFSGGGLMAASALVYSKKRKARRKGEK